MVSETELSDHKRFKFIRTSFYDSVFPEDVFNQIKRDLETMKFFPISKLSHNFSLHVKNIYGLSKEEVPYTLKKYIDAILLKINGWYWKNINNNRFIRTYKEFCKVHNEMMITFILLGILLLVGGSLLDDLFPPNDI